MAVSSGRPDPVFVDRKFALNMLRDSVQDVREGEPTSKLKVLQRRTRTELGPGGPRRAPRAASR
jgi:hypothetical protein